MGGWFYFTFPEAPSFREGSQITSIPCIFGWFFRDNRVNKGAIFVDYAITLFAYSSTLLSLSGKAFSVVVISMAVVLA